MDQLLTRFLEEATDSVTEKQINEIRAYNSIILMILVIVQMILGYYYFLSGLVGTAVSIVFFYRTYKTIVFFYSLILSCKLSTPSLLTGEDIDKGSHNLSLIQEKITCTANIAWTKIVTGFSLLLHQCVR